MEDNYWDDLTLAKDSDDLQSRDIALTLIKELRDYLSTLTEHQLDLLYDEVGDLLIPLIRGL